MSDEFLKGMSPMISEVLLSDIADCSHQSLDIFDKNVITSNQDLLLRGLRTTRRVLILRQTLHTLLVMSRHLRGRFGARRGIVLAVSLRDLALARGDRS